MATLRTRAFVMAVAVRNMSTKPVDNTVDYRVWLRASGRPAEQSCSSAEKTHSLELRTGSHSHMRVAAPMPSR